MIVARSGSALRGPSEDEGESTRRTIRGNAVPLQPMAIKITTEVNTDVPELEGHSTPDPDSKSCPLEAIDIQKYPSRISYDSPA